MTAIAQHHLSEGSQFSQELQKKELGGAHLVELRSMQVKSPSPIDDTSSNISEKMVIANESASSPTFKAKVMNLKKVEESKSSRSGGVSPTSPSKSPKMHRKHEIESPSKSKKKRREDRRGVCIKKGSRRHHISFIDDVTGKSLAQIFFVESYKEYNRLQEKPDNGCRCQVF